MALRLKKLACPVAVAVVWAMTALTVLHAQDTRDGDGDANRRDVAQQTETNGDAQAPEANSTGGDGKPKDAPATVAPDKDAAGKPAPEKDAAGKPAPDKNAADKPAPEKDAADKPAPVITIAAGVYQPANELEKGAHAMLEKHCARCHQAGALERKKPAGDFGNILDLKTIAQTPRLIIPGNPDGSRLYRQIVNEKMPYDLFKERDFDRPAPTPMELTALRDWISSLGDASVLACKDRKFMDNAGIVKAIGDDLKTLKQHRLEGTRYIILTNLYNACASDEEMKVYRHAVIKLLNSLSGNSDVVKLNAVDEARTVIRFNLDDVAWSAQDWERIVAAYPYASRPDTVAFAFLADATQTRLPYIRGDWFAYTASRPPLYYDLLKLPKTFQRLTDRIGLDIKSNIKNHIAQRAGLQHSGVSWNNRLIERHPIAAGAFWVSYDFVGKRGRQSLFDFPLGPGGRYGFRADGGEVIFSLPNGFQAYYLNTARGRRLDKAPVSMVRDPSRADRSVIGGISCFGCHDQGVRAARDDIREAVLKDRRTPKSVRETVEALYPPHDVMDKHLATDRKRFRDAMTRAGLDAALGFNGVEIINVLSSRYEAKVDLRLAAAAFGMEKSVFLNAMTAAGSKAFAIKRRLEQGLLPRDQFEAFYAELLPRVSDDLMIAKASRKNKVEPVARVRPDSPKSTGGFDLTLFSDKSFYRVDDHPVFTVSTKAKCYLTLINVDKTGFATVIFPNKFQRKNLIAAGKTLRFPGPDAPFRFRLKRLGRELVIAACNASGKQVDGIRHDFAAAAFTELGDYNALVTRRIVAGAKRIKRLKGKRNVKARAIVARAAIRFEVK